MLVGMILSHTTWFRHGNGCAVDSETEPGHTESATHKLPLAGLPKQGVKMDAGLFPEEQPKATVQMIFSLAQCTWF